MIEVFKSVGDSLCGWPGAPIVVVFDCTPVHVSKEFRRRVKEELEWVKLVFVPPTHTGTAQPLDVAYNGVLKAFLSRVATTHFGKLFLDALEADQKDARHVDTRLSSLKQLFPHWVGASLDELSARDDVRSLGWRHLWVEEGEARKAIIAEAQKLHKEGNMFRHVVIKGVPEEAPSDGEDEDQGEAEKDENEEEEGFSLLNPDDDVSWPSFCFTFLDPQL